MQPKQNKELSSCLISWPISSCFQESEAPSHVTVSYEDMHCNSNYYGILRDGRDLYSSSGPTPLQLTEKLTARSGY